MISNFFAGSGLKLEPKYFGSVIITEPGVNICPGCPGFFFLIFAGHGVLKKTE